MAVTSHVQEREIYSPRCTGSRKAPFFSLPAPHLIPTLTHFCPAPPLSSMGAAANTPVARESRGQQGEGLLAQAPLSSLVPLAP